MLKSLSLTAEDQWLHTNSARSICSDVYLHHYRALFPPIMARILQACAAVSVRNDASITFTAKVSTDINMEQLLFSEFKSEMICFKNKSLINIGVGQT